MQIKEFVLSREEAYEFEWKNQKTRRPGDPPLHTPTPAATKSNKKKKGKKSKKSKSKKDTANEL